MFGILNRYRNHPAAIALRLQPPVHVCTELRVCNDFRPLFGFVPYSVYPGTSCNPISELFAMIEPSPSEALEAPAFGAGRPHNRVAAVLMHIPWYSIVGPARLARDAGVAKSTISRLLSGRTTPSYRVVMAVTAAIERRTGRTLGAHELFSTTGTFPTQNVCSLMHCAGCLPGDIYDRQTDTVHPQFRALRSGTWALSVRTGCPATVISQQERLREGGSVT